VTAVLGDNIDIMKVYDGPLYGKAGEDIAITDDGHEDVLDGEGEVVASLSS